MTFVFFWRKRKHFCEMFRVERISQKNVSEPPRTTFLMKFFAFQFIEKTIDFFSVCLYINRSGCSMWLKENTKFCTYWIILIRLKFLWINYVDLNFSSFKLFFHFYIIVRDIDKKQFHKQQAIRYLETINLFIETIFCSSPCFICWNASAHIIDCFSILSEKLNNTKPKVAPLFFVAKICVASHTKTSSRFNSPTKFDHFGLH